MPHFLPSFNDIKLAKLKTRSRGLFQAGYLQIETSGSLLSHRPASRLGDDIVIWSLLISEKTLFDSAEAFWTSMQGPIFEGMRISTSYLISSTPRLNIKGLRWAPASPTFYSAIQPGDLGFHAFDGDDGEQGWITPEGLVADWLYWRIDGHNAQTSLNERFPHNASRIRTQYLQGYRWGVILCPIQHGVTMWKRGGSRWWMEGGSLWRTIVVICGTNETEGSVSEAYTVRHGKNITPAEMWEKNEVTGWQWRGVHVWDNVEPLPTWNKIEKFLII